MGTDFSWIVSIVSVVSSAVITVISVITTAKTQREIEAKKHEYELAAENLRHVNAHGDALRQKQYEIISQMGPLAIHFDAGDYSDRDKLYALALQLAACADLSNSDDYVGESASSLLHALTNNFKNRDKIKWSTIIESCARAVNYQWSSPSSQSPVSQTSSRTSPHQKEKQPLFAQFASAVRAGYSAFRDTLKSNSR